MSQQKQQARAPFLTTDAVVFVSPSQILLIRRARPPFEGMWALPGGFVEYGETVEDAILREVREETGVQGRIVALLGVYSDPARDPRGHTVSVVFIVTGRRDQIHPGDDAADARLVPFPPTHYSLAFDHSQIILDALRWLKDHPLTEEDFR